MNRALLAAATLFLSALLAGCATVGEAVERSAIGDGLDGNLRTTVNANLQANVWRNEVYGDYALRNHEGRAGVADGERAYRRVLLQVVLPEGGRPMAGFSGYRVFQAVIPDGMPMLRQGDIVEVRSTTVFDGLKGFAQTGEGTAVTRLLCQAGSKPGKEEQVRFKACASKLPWHEPWGEEKRYYFGILAAKSNTPFKPSLRAHTELRFSPYYDGNGKPLPNATPPSARNEP